MKIYSLTPYLYGKLGLKPVESIRERTKHEVVAIDGKSIRGANPKKNGNKMPHIVSAFAAQNGITLGQIKVNEKNNEITAIPKLLELLALEDCIVTIDAMGCQTNIAEK